MSECGVDCARKCFRTIRQLVPESSLLFKSAGHASGSARLIPAERDAELLRDLLVGRR